MFSNSAGPTQAPELTRAERRQDFLARTFDDPTLARYQNRGARRRLSILQAALSLLLVAVPQVIVRWHDVDPSLPSWAIPVAAIGLLLLPWMFVTGMLNASVFGIFDLRGHQLDEAERQHRDDAYRSAYRAIIGISIVAMGILAANTTIAVPVISTYLMLIVLLPLHIAAWRMTGS